MKNALTLGLALITTSASALAANVNVVTNPYVTDVKYSKVFIDVRDSGSTLTAGGVYIYHTPMAKNQYGQFKEIFISSTNGTQFCRTLGHRARNTSGDGGDISCGEDESSFTEYDFYARRWISKSTGSANQCYPLYKTIECK
jgi:hypothetical protein